MVDRGVFSDLGLTLDTSTFQVGCLTPKSIRSREALVRSLEASLPDPGCCTTLRLQVFGPTSRDHLVVLVTLASGQEQGMFDLLGLLQFIYLFFFWGGGKK